MPEKMKENIKIALIVLSLLISAFANYNADKVATAIVKNEVDSIKEDVKELKMSKADYDVF